MTNKEANSKAVKLFNQFKNYRTHEQKEQLRKECLKLHKVYKVYEVLTDKNALKMASICSSLRFVEPWQMLIQLQRTTNTY